jgi:hypothetical protein
MTTDAANHLALVIEAHGYLHPDEDGWQSIDFLASWGERHEATVQSLMELGHDWIVSADDVIAFRPRQVGATPS